MDITLFDTVGTKKRIFESLRKGAMSMYVCGITPYDYAHIGHSRCYVFFDLVYRLFKILGYQVTYCRNFTDVDDKLIGLSEKEFGDKCHFTELAGKFIKAYTEDMQKLGCLSPDYEPRVTGTIPEIIEMVQLLIEKGYAYEVNGDVYFEVAKFRGYGKLSKRKLEASEVQSRLDDNPLKRSPLDFALWKAEKDHCFWDSSWGHGRPGWHIECSAMAKKFLGKTIDIHGGGMDLIFPHHENEIAQSEAANDVEFARNWLHNAFVNVNKEKMSKSLGNFFTLRDVFERFHPMVLRFYLLSHSYRTPINFSWDELASYEKGYRRLTSALGEVPQKAKINQRDLWTLPVCSSILTALCDDFNSAAGLGILFDRLGEVLSNPEEAAGVAYLCKEVLGLDFVKQEKRQMPPLSQKAKRLIAEREAARERKDWKTADELRDELRKLGVEVQDRKTGKLGR